jgi:hypothetical protein
MKTIKYTGLTIVACIEPMDNFESIPRKPGFAAKNRMQPAFRPLLARRALDFCKDQRRFLLQGLHGRCRFYTEEQNI